MRIDWSSGDVDFDSDEQKEEIISRYGHQLHISTERLLVINVDTGEPVTLDIKWADDKTGEYEQVLRNESGNYYVDNDGFLASKVVRANIKFVFKDKQQ